MARPAAILTELLVEHGVPERGARLYAAACRDGPQTVAELARLAGLHRVEAYRFLRLLESQGLLRSTGNRPRQYVALPVDQLVDKWIHRAEERLHRMRGGRERLLAEWQEAIEAPDPADPRKFAVLEGRRTIQRFLLRRVATARRELLLSVSGFSLVPAIDGGVDRALKAARHRGLKVRLVTEVTASNLAEAKHFAGFCELRHASSPVTNRAIVLDRSGALVFVSGEEGLGTSGDDQVALWSSTPSVLRLAREYHQRLWAGGVPLERRLLELEGPAGAGLSVARDRDKVPFDRMREITQLGMRASGLDSVRFDLPELIQTVARQMGREIAPLVAGGDPLAVARSLGEHYARRAPGKLEVLNGRPLTLRVTQCFACTPQGTEVGRVFCPRLLQTVFEERLGPGWSVSAPDPTRHATKGCLFTVTPG